jgi:hypothetical protein
MRRRVTIRLDKILRPDQITHLAERAIDAGIAEIQERQRRDPEGKQRPKRQGFTPLSAIFSDIGMTIPEAARHLIREAREESKKLPRSVKTRTKMNNKKASRR